MSPNSHVFWMMNSRTPNCLMVLRPSASPSSASLVVGSAGGMRRASWSAAHRGSSCSVRLFLLVACNLVGRILVADDRGGQSDHHSLWTRSPKKLSDTYIHIQSCSQTQVNHSLIVLCLVQAQPEDPDLCIGGPIAFQSPSARETHIATT